MGQTDFDVKLMKYYLWELILRWLNSITNCVSKFPGLSSHLKLSLKSLSLGPSLSPARPGQPRGSSLSWGQPGPVTRGSITSSPSTISCSRPGVCTVAGWRFLKIYIDKKYIYKIYNSQRSWLFRQSRGKMLQFPHFIFNLQYSEWN